MNEILKYQELDLEIVRLEGEIGENSDRKSALKMQQYLKDCQAKLIELNQKAKEIDDTYKKYKEIYNQMAQNLELINKNLDCKDEKKIAGLIEANDAITNNLVKLESKISTIIKECTAIQTEYASIMKNARSAKSNMQKYKENFESAKQKIEVEIATKKKELESIGKKVDKALLAKYNQKRSEKSNVFVPEIKGRCGGCRMEIPVSKLSLLKSAGMIDCENCGRVIYNK